MNRANAVSEDTRFRVLRLLEENPHASQREIAAALGVSLGGVNFCLKALIGKGFLKIENIRKIPALSHLIAPVPKNTLTKCL